MGKWRKLNAVAGGLVFGIPAVLAVPAVIATVIQFGLISLIQTAPLVMLASTPLWLWMRWMKHPPRKRSTCLAWGWLACVILASVLLSPLNFWAGPVLLVLMSEGALILTNRLKRRAVQGRSLAGSSTGLACKEGLVSAVSHAGLQIFRKVRQKPT